MNHKKHTPRLCGLMPAILLSVWYLCAVCGIDIHRDAEHGQVFVVPGFVGFDCDLIHPGQHCFDTATDTDCLDGEDCCSDDFTAVLALGEDPDSGADILPAPVSIPFSAFHPHHISAGMAAVSGVWCNGPPAPLLSVSFLKSSVLRI
ncbi:MAG: hypothetical protein J6P69_05595 [Bacteroidales bacterium]|nr:hypothetical protein [Bacteroidales bacterium]